MPGAKGFVLARVEEAADPFSLSSIPYYFIYKSSCVPVAAISLVGGKVL